jgi:hypothetical protein
MKNVCYLYHNGFLILAERLYRVPQNLPNNSVRQCQLMLDDNEKNYEKNSTPLRFEDMGTQKLQL